MMSGPELAGLFLILSPVYSKVTWLVKSVVSLPPRDPGPLDSASWKECVPLENHNQSHGVWDIPLAGNGDWNPRTYEVVDGHTDSSPVLPPQGADKIRLTIREASKEEQVWDSGATSGFTALSSQWGRGNSYSWYHIKTYETQVPARVLRCVRVSKDQDQKRQIELKCQTFVVRKVAERPDPALFLLTARLFEELRALDAHYRPIRADENWKRAFLLQFHHACLSSFAEFLATLVLQGGRGIDEDINPSSAELRRWNLVEIAKHSYECQSLQEMARELISTSESLIEVVKGSATIAEDAQKTIKFMAIEAELHAYCREVNGRLQRLSDGLEHDLKFLELARNVNQTRGVQRLTLLATIFLPLSLAAGVLSMQTRFKNLGSLLYDFFGVVVLLGAIVVIILTIMTTFTIIKEAEHRLTKYTFYRTEGRRIFITWLILGLFPYGSLVLSSFLVGMFKNVLLGAKILGYGSAAAVGLALVLLLPLIPKLLYYPVPPIVSPRPTQQKGKQTNVDGPEGTVEDIQLEVMAPPGHESLEGISIVGSETR